MEVKVAREGGKKKAPMSCAWRRADWEGYAKRCEKGMRKVDREGTTVEEVRGLMMEAAQEAIPTKGCQSSTGRIGTKSSGIPNFEGTRPENARTKKNGID